MFRIGFIEVRVRRRTKKLEQNRLCLSHTRALYCASYPALSSIALYTTHLNTSCMLAYHVSMYVPGSHPIRIITIFAVNLPIERALPLNKCMTVILRNSTPYSTIVARPARIMSKSQTANQRCRRALQKVSQLVGLSRLYEKPESNGPRRTKTRFARKQWKHALSDKHLPILEVCEANCDAPRRPDSRKLKRPQCRKMQRKYSPSDRLPPIPEDFEVGFEDALKAEPQNTEHWKVKIPRAKPRQHWEVRDEFGQGKRASTITTPPVILESLVAIWINHGGSVVVMVLLGALASSLVC